MTSDPTTALAGDQAVAAPADPWHDVQARAEALRAYAMTGAGVDDLTRACGRDAAVVIAAVTLLDRQQGRVRGTAAARYRLERVLRKLASGAP